MLKPAPLWNVPSSPNSGRALGVRNGIPRRINRLCSRVLLAGALEQTWEFSAEMVQATMFELEEDLGAGQHAPLAGASDGHGPDGASMPIGELDELHSRLDALERTVNRRERVFKQMMSLLADNGGRR